jgi:hypothetical protein
MHNNMELKFLYIVSTWHSKPFEDDFEISIVSNFQFSWMNYNDHNIV